jgi:predicted acyl esterase
MGVPQSALSELQKWEGPDPAFWVDKGYAIVNPDPRGVGKSEGNIYQWGSQEGQDGADVIDWVGEQEWCSSKVTLSGNSYLSISQWFIAAEQPKHLTCIAPWEGFTDLYAEGLLAGGVITKPALDFGLKILSVNAGENTWENTIEMALKHELFSDYHKDKRAKIERINVPAYVVASWSNPIHTPGTFSGFMQLKTDKWLRVHDSWEWPDYYQEDNRDDLLRFYDFYMKGIKNGWDQTPKVRMKIIDTAKVLPMTGTPMTSTSFPPPNTTKLKLFLGPSGGLTKESPTPYELTYKAKDGRLDFAYEFSEDTILCGQIEMKLAVSLSGNKDSDIFIFMEKELTSGATGYQIAVPYRRWWQSTLVRFAYYMRLTSDINAIIYYGPEGRIRVSRRVQNEELSKMGIPVQRLDISSPVEEEEIVELNPGFTPIGMHFSKGEKLKFRITGIDSHAFPPVDQAVLEVTDCPNLNDTGSVTIHCGRKDGIQSHISLPILR